MYGWDELVRGRASEEGPVDGEELVDVPRQLYCSGMLVMDVWQWVF